MHYTKTSPCDSCPFRYDVPGFLMPGRVDELEQSLVRSGFPCHKTVDHDEETGEGIERKDSIHCAGALILLEKLEQPSQMMRICERLGMYDRSKLKMDAPVFEDFSEMADHHDGSHDAVTKIGNRTVRLTSH